MNTALSQKSTCSTIGLNTEEKSFPEAVNTFETKPKNTFVNLSLININKNVLTLSRGKKDEEKIVGNIGLYADDCLGDDIDYTRILSGKSC
ncbi:MAG TPA: hypothetical protein VN377_06125 [Candidatus Thermoplasmatota archaeon]|nr:hypothetical protein [Candidatus Thermoplasmatota archaeon]